MNPLTAPSMSAPELLAALRNALPIVEDHARTTLEGGLTAHTIRLAIARAEGR